MKSNIGALVDDLGRVKAEMARLAEREKALRDQIVEAGVGAYEGDLFRATVSDVERSILDMDAVRAKLSPQFIRANSSVVCSTTVRVVARKGVSA